MKILIVDDEPELLSALCDYLAEAGYVCETADRFDTAYEKVSLYEYDIVLLDITLPGGNGLRLIETIKQNSLKTGIIVVSAKDSLDDKISGLDLGADDYMTKPFQLSELNSRIKAVLRRRHFEGTSQIRFNEILVDTSGKTVEILDQPITLTKKEFDLLLYFQANKTACLPKNRSPSTFGATTSIWPTISTSYTRTSTTCGRKSWQAVVAITSKQFTGWATNSPTHETAHKVKYPLHCLFAGGNDRFRNSDLCIDIDVREPAT